MAFLLLVLSRLAFLLLSLRAVAGAESENSAKTYMRQYWNDNYDIGERAILTTRGNSLLPCSSAPLHTSGQNLSHSRVRAHAAQVLARMTAPIR
jgi:hypothetical protein